MIRKKQNDWKLLKREYYKNGALMEEQIEDSQENILKKVFYKTGKLKFINFYRKKSFFADWSKQYRSDGEIWLVIFNEEKIIHLLIGNQRNNETE